MHDKADPAATAEVVRTTMTGPADPHRRLRTSPSTNTQHALPLSGPGRMSSQGNNEGVRKHASVNRK